MTDARIHFQPDSLLVGGGTGHRPSQEQRDALCAEIAKGTPGMTVTAEPFRGCFHQESTTFTVRVGAIHVEADDGRLHDRIAAADPTLAGDVYEELAFALLSKLATHGQDLTLHRKLRRLALEFIDRRRQIIAEAKATEAAR